MTSSTSCPSTPFPRVSTSRRRSAASVSARAALGVPATLARDSIAATAWRCLPSPSVASRESPVAEPSSPSTLDNDSVGDDTGGSSSEEATGAGAPARFFALPFAMASENHDRWTNDDRPGQQKASVVADGGCRREPFPLRPTAASRSAALESCGRDAAGSLRFWARPFSRSGCHVRR